MGKFIRFLNESNINKIKSDLKVSGNESLQDWFERNQTRLEDQFEKINSEKTGFGEWFTILYKVLKGDIKDKKFSMIWNDADILNESLTVENMPEYIRVHPHIGKMINEFVSSVKSWMKVTNSSAEEAIAHMLEETTMGNVSIEYAKKLLKDQDILK
jgi:hypothetical protein